MPQLHGTCPYQQVLAISLNSNLIKYLVFLFVESSNQISQIIGFLKAHFHTISFNSKCNPGHTAPANPDEAPVLCCFPITLSYLSLGIWEFQHFNQSEEYVVYSQKGPNVSPSYTILYSLGGPFQVLADRVPLQCSGVPI